MLRVLAAVHIAPPSPQRDLKPDIYGIPPGRRASLMLVGAAPTALLPG
jgi:hypothetical protein